MKEHYLITLLLKPKLGHSMPNGVHLSISPTFCVLCKSSNMDAGILIPRQDNTWDREDGAYVGNT